MGVSRHRVPLACYLLLKRENKLLLIRRFNTGWQDGDYTLVSGHLDGNESARMAMQREAKEEAGISVEVRDLRIIYVLHRLDNSTGEEYIDFFLTCDSWAGEPSNMEPQKCDDMKWFEVDKLPKNITPNVAFALERISRKEFYGELGFNMKTHGA